MNTYNSSEKPLIEREKDVIYIKGLNRAKAVSQFINAIQSGIKSGFDNFYIDTSELDEGVFPNSVVAISALIELYSKENVSFEFGNIKFALTTTQFLHPHSFNGKTDHILNRIWKFSNSMEISTIVDAYGIELRKEDRFSIGTISSLLWSLNEVMDNVLIHSKAEFGYVMGQIHKSSKNIAFSVCDYGIGILNSLRESNLHKPHTAIDAITLAIKEEVTRDSSVGQGNGLFGLHSIISQGNGILEITSSGASYRLSGDKTFINKKLPKHSMNKPGTIIDFQLNYGKDISLENALKFRGKDFSIVDLYIENFDDDQGHNYYSVKDHSGGTGTRDSALRIKNEVMNLITETKKPVIIDFKEIAVISSSFADELIAKLLLELGLFQFNNLIILRGMNSQEQNILQRSVIQRLVDTLNEPTTLL